MFPLWPILAAAFVLGLFFGSFLNVCIARIPSGESIVKPRSHCPRCLAPIRWYDNIPVLSYLLLKARCRTCHTPVSAQYPAVELATAVWFAALGYQFVLTVRFFAGSQVGNAVTPEMWASAILTTLSLLILGFLLIGLLVMDWQTHRLPDAFTYTGIGIALFLTCTRAIFLGPTEDQVLLHHKAPITAAMSVEKGNVFLTGPEALIGGRLVAIVAAAAILLAVRAVYRLLRDREGMGLGDVKLLAMIAAFLGFLPALLSLFFGVLAGALYGVALLARGRANRATPLPFGSFLAAGGLLAALFGNGIIDTYTRLLR